MAGLMDLRGLTPTNKVLGEQARRRSTRVEAAKPAPWETCG